MNIFEKILASLIVVASVATFYALVAFLGGYGAIISACIVAGLLSTNPNE